MKIGDVVYWPCMNGFHWLAYTIERFDHYGSPEAIITHTCRGVELRETRRFDPEYFDASLTPDLPLPAFAHCWRCTVPLFQGRNVGSSLYLDCCEDATWVCSRCDHKPLPSEDHPTWQDWLLREHPPVCGDRCADCHVRVAGKLAWKCVGYGSGEQKPCAPTRCEACFAAHRQTCTQAVFRSADHRCPECEHGAIEVIDGASGKIRRCTWCKAEWQAYYLNDQRHAWPTRTLQPGEDSL